MGRLISSLSVSIDGFAAAAGGSLNWVRVDEELHGAFNDEARDVGAFLYGRRMYEVMAAYWPTALDDPDASPAMREFAALWQATPKVVFSSRLEAVDHGCRLVRGDAVAEVAAMKAATDGELGVGGPTLAGSLLRAGLVDEVRLYLQPVVLGGGLPFLPTLESPVPLRLLETRTFLTSGVTLVRYGVER